MRLIDADALLEILKRDEEYNKDIPERADGIRDAIMDVINAPSAEPDRKYIEQLRWERDIAIQQLKELGYGLGEKPREPERKKGEWIKTPYPDSDLVINYNCPFCKKVFLTQNAQKQDLIIA